MSDEILLKNLMLLGRGIEVCLSQELTAPALILMYSAIDTTGWLDSKDEFATRDSFVNWVERYLFATGTYPCTALELYAARCGLLHTSTPDSKLTKDGKSRLACYAWKAGKAADFQRLIDKAGLGQEYFVIHAQNDLYDGWRTGLLTFVTELQADAPRMKAVEAKASRFFRDVGIEPVQDYLNAVDGGGKLP